MGSYMQTLLKVNFVLSHLTKRPLGTQIASQTGVLHLSAAQLDTHAPEVGDQANSMHRKEWPKSEAAGNPSAYTRTLAKSTMSPLGMHTRE